LALPDRASRPRFVKCDSPGVPVSQHGIDGGIEIGRRDLCGWLRKNRPFLYSRRGIGVRARLDS
jgi:hypothetical protein